MDRTCSAMTATPFASRPNGDWLKWIVRIVTVAWAGFITVEALESRDFRNRGDSFTRGDAAHIEARLTSLENSTNAVNGRAADMRQDLGALRSDIGDLRKEIISGINELRQADKGASQ